VSARDQLKSLAFVAGLFAFGQAQATPMQLAPAAAVPTDDCAPKQIDQQAKVSIVYDGSTFLIDNSYTRLTGVHVPAASKQLEPPEPLGKAVAQAVGELIKRSHGIVGIEYDQLKSDKGTVFTHLFLADGRNLAKVLLENGFALVDTRLPNTAHAQCYRDAESRARAQKKGLWQYEDKGVPVIEAKQLTGDRAGFQIVRGRIVRAEQGEQYFILNMDTVGFRISKEAMKLFNEKDLFALKGKVVEIRDNLTYKALVGDSQGTMFGMLDHPGQIDLLADKFYAEQVKKSAQLSAKK
jgi:endonuclease YncB( thermonuclease family)